MTDSEAKQAAQAWAHRHEGDYHDSVDAFLAGVEWKQERDREFMLEAIRNGDWQTNPNPTEEKKDE